MKHFFLRSSLDTGMGLLVLVATICVLTTCRSSVTTSLIDGFVSYQSVQDVRNQIAAAGLGSAWTEEQNWVDPNDRRSRHDFITLSGKFRHLGQDGSLKLTFFNDRLMETDFSVSNGDSYLTALRVQVKGIPTVAKHEVEISHHTKVVYYVDVNGGIRCVWKDANLDREWMKWVRDNT